MGVLELVYIDPEPPGPAGGGIRAYLRLALKACRAQGIAARVFSHSPESFPGEAARPIGRKPWLGWPLRPLAYRLIYHENVLWEQARWLAAELAKEDHPDRVYEFADFQGLAYFALRDPDLRRRCVVRIHTPAYMTLSKPRGLKARLAAASLAFRERDTLMGRATVTAPSAAFVKERLSWVKDALHLPNPLPDGPSNGSLEFAGAEGATGLRGPGGQGLHILYLGRIESRKGILTLLAGFLPLAKEDKDLSLTLVGAEVEPYATKVRSLLEQCPPSLRSRVTLESPCPPNRLGALLSRFDILAVPSLWENSPYVYFEGMAAGLVCVGSATGEMQEVSRETGDLLATPGEPEAWKHALREAAAIARDPLRLAQARKSQGDYLEARRADIPLRMADLYRKITVDAATGGAGP